MRILTSLLLFFIGKSQGLYPLSLERLWTKIDVAGAIERFVNGVNEYYEVTGNLKQKSAIFTNLEAKDDYLTNFTGCHF